MTLHFSPSHLEREFKKHTGITVMQYNLKTRIVLAKGELKKTNPDVEKNIFNSIHRANIDTLVSYKLGNEMHSFLDGYDAAKDE